MPSIDSIVSVTITATSPGVTRAGFGVPMILGTPSWTERTRTYTDLSGVAADFAATRPEYLAAQAIFAQSPRPPSLVIGRLSSKPTQHWTITPVVANNTNYTMTVNGQTVTYTSDGTALNTEIVAGLIALINALAAPAPTCTASGTTTLILTSNAPGNWDAVSVANPALLSLVQDHVDPGVSADLDAIFLENSSWYAIVNPWNSQLMATAVATWAESNKRFFACASQDSPIITTVLSGATDLAASLKTAARKYTAVAYHPNNGAWLDAAWLGQVLPLDPGSETWALKQLSGPTAVSLTSTQRTNALAKNANVYETIAGVNVTEMGTMADGEYIDVIRFIDWMSARMKERVFADLASNPKIPFTDDGIAQIAGDVRSVLSDGVSVGGLVSYTLSVPKAKDLAPADKSARILKGVNFTATLAGAAHTVQVQGSVSV